MTSEADGTDGGADEDRGADGYDLDAGPDPATVAESRPEPDWSAGDVQPMVEAVGIGPGNLDHLTPRARTAISEADVVVGFSTVIDYVDDVITGDRLACGYRDEAETLTRFATRVAAGESGTAVLMGDPNHSGYQFLGKVQAAVETAVEAAVGDSVRDAEGSLVRVVPGISALQIAASRARTPMEASTFVTLHKSGSLAGDVARLERDVGDRHLLVLPRPFDWMPERVASHLVESGADPTLTAIVYEHLTHEAEAVTHTTLGALGTEAPSESRSREGGDEVATGREATAFSDLSVLVVRRE